MPRSFSFMSNKSLAFATCLACTVILSGCSRDAEPDIEAQPETNVLLAQWTGPYGGVPAFDKMELEALKPALEIGMAGALQELEVIATNPASPTFENTIVAMERVGRDLDRVRTYMWIWGGSLSTPQSRAIQKEMGPKLSEHWSRITGNQALFARVQTVYESDEVKQLSASEQRLVGLVYDRFARRGATLSGDAANRYAAINKRLSELHIQFSNNVLADEESYVTWFGEDQTRGLPGSFLKAAAAAAIERGGDNKYAVTNTRSSMAPFLTFSDERALREQVWHTYYNRGDNGDQHDNNAVIPEILQLRHERVQLLGYENYATWNLENRMAHTPTNAFGLMDTMWKASTARVAEEVADMQAVANREGAQITVKPWDYRHYAEKVRREKFALDSDELRQYLQLDKLREAMFMVAGELFNFSFTPVPDGSVPVFHEDMKVWEVTDRTSGAHIGLWYLDPFARKGKRSGAWAGSYRSHETFDGKRTVLSSNNSNFVKPAPGEPVLVSWDDATTFFHEFGHALHGLSSNVAYPTLNRGVRDYTEFHSQILERWLLTDRVINNYLVHHETGEPIPSALVDKIKRAATFNQGFETTEYLASALMDMTYHTTDPSDLDPDAFERARLVDLDMPDAIVMRHRSPHFGHVFSGEGYSAGYYGYLWSDVLASDAAEAFAEAPGGFYDKEVAAKLVTHLFATRNSVDPAEAYRTFRGRDPHMEALMRDRGFPVP